MKKISRQDAKSAKGRQALTGGQSIVYLWRIDQRPSTTDQRLSSVVRPSSTIDHRPWTNVRIKRRTGVLR